MFIMYLIPWNKRKVEPVPVRRRNCYRRYIYCIMQLKIDWKSSRKGLSARMTTCTEVLCAAQEEAMEDETTSITK
jgi:hypothetical protein